MKGLSRANLLYMRAFAEAWPDEEFVQQVVGQIPWGHNIVLLSKVKSREEREWYIRKAIKTSLPTIEQLEAELAGEEQAQEKVELTGKE